MFSVHLQCGRHENQGEVLVMKKFMKFYLPFRAVVLAVGTFPGIFIWWPLAILLISISPQFVSDAMTVGLYWLIDDVLMFGNAAEYPRVRFVITLIFPSLVAYTLIMVENITSFHVDVARARGIK